MKFDLSAYMANVYVTKQDHPEWRRGQTFFNVLNDMYPEVADRVRSTEYDPFYQDERLPHFLEYVTTLALTQL